MTYSTFCDERFGVICEYGSFDESSEMDPRNNGIPNW